MTQRYIGLMSGTSLDAVDAVLLEVHQDNVMRITHRHSKQPPSELRSSLLALTTGEESVSLPQVGDIHQRTGIWFAEAVNELMTHAQLEAKDVRAIGSHGQTLWHAPDTAFPFSWQCGDANTIAARSGICTVSDFRQADIAVGGQGAPLVPAFHHAAFSSETERRCIVNIGGIANISLLPALHTNEPVIGFDTGPGNALLDAWSDRHTGQPQDTNAYWATSGTIDQTLLTLLTADAYFQKAPPKSTGRETFNLPWLNQYLTKLPYQPAAVDVQRTLVELTAVTIAEAIQNQAPETKRIILCGGGAHNPLLRHRISAHLTNASVTNTREYGIHEDWVEAAAFAWLAQRSLEKQAGNIPTVTGAAKPVVLGSVHDPHVTDQPHLTALHNP